jgi:hypothetical protein
MPDQSVTVCDLETVPDLAAAARMVDMPLFGWLCFAAEDANHVSIVGRDLLR